MGLNQRVQRYNMVLFSLAQVGLILSVYTLVVEHDLEEDPDSVAMCDISEHMSCSKAFSSKYGKGFGFLGDLLGEDSMLNQPNSIPGIIYYLGYSILCVSNSSSLSYIVFGASSVSILMSIYLAYVLIFVLKDICIVCFSIHLINTLLLVTSYYKYKTITSLKYKIKNN